MDHLEKIDTAAEDYAGQQTHGKHLGTVRLHTEDTHELILVPAPTDDPNDPLNWKKWHRNYILGLTTFTTFMGNFLAIGPSVTLVETAVDFFNVMPPTPADPQSLAPTNLARFSKAIDSISYFYSVPALSLGISNLFWMPLIVKYGRRPIYMVSLSIYFGSALWAAYDKSYAGAIAARFFLGFGAGAAESLAPLTVTDLFFLHERGAIMAIVNVAANAGGAVSCVIAGLISIKKEWNVIYFVGAGLIALTLVLVAFTMPETAYPRQDKLDTAFDDKAVVNDEKKHDATHVERADSVEETQVRKQTYREMIRFRRTSLSSESIFRIFIRPVLMLPLPGVLWATVVLGLNIGFFVVITTTLPTALSTIYQFDTYQIGLVWLAQLIGVLLALPLAGWLSDYVADFFTKRNGGIREPEMRLPAMITGTVLMPVAMLVYGLGLNYQLHWMVPTLGVGLFGFAFATVGNVSIVYSIDSYRPVAGEVIVTQMGFKACVSFLMAFYATAWVQKTSYASAFGTMAGVTFTFYACWVPLFVWGRRLRHASMKWKVMTWAAWDDDRETGE